MPSLTSQKTMDASFRKGLLEAKELFKELSQERLERETALVGKVSKLGGCKPSPYVKLKSNRPFGG